MDKVFIFITQQGSRFIPYTEEDSLDRELQSKELGRIMAASYPRPVIFLGYVVTKPLDVRRKL